VKGNKKGKQRENKSKEGEELIQKENKKEKAT